MKHIIAQLLTAAMLLLVCGISFAAYTTKNEARHVSGEALVLIKMTDEEREAKTSCEKFEKLITEHAKRVASCAESEVVSIMTDLSLSSDKIFAHLRSKSLTADELIERLKKCPEVSAAERNHITPLPVVK
ncbi:MAG: hypothetical protein Q4E17_02125 [Synergistes sp.]|nr:hypothetical protein [Synergistes sp.]